MAQESDPARRGDAVYLPVEDQPDRNLVVLLLDTSGSMGVAEEEGKPAKIDQLDEALKSFLQTGMHSDSALEGGINRLEVNGEIAIGAFREEYEGDYEVRWLQLADNAVTPGSPFYYVQHVTGLSDAALAQLEPRGRTPLAEAIDQALDVIEQRKDGLLEDGLTHECRPNLYLLTDGAATTPVGDVAERLHNEEAQNRVVFWAFGTPKCRRDELLLLANKGGNCIFLNRAPLEKVLSFLNKSMRHQPGASSGATSEDLAQWASEELHDDPDMSPE